MTDVRVVHTADLDAAALEAAHNLLREVFSDLEDTDWEHSLGGLHALAYDGDTLVGHAAVVQRRLVHDSRILRAGYVEGVAVKESHRRQGLAGALMAEIERIIQRAYDIGALGSTDLAEPFYAGRGWQVWRGPLSAITPEGTRRTPDEDGSIYVFSGGQPMDVSGRLTCDWREGDVW
jgi:aminoglycoside 2'-N-acetyltransferase I